MVVALMILVGRQHRGDGQCGRRTANRDRPRRQDGLVRLEAQQAADEHTNQDCCDNGHHDQGDNRPTERHHVARRDAQTQQRDANTQDVTACKVDAGGKSLVFRQKIECHTEQQRIQHRGPTQLIADEPDGQCNCRAQQQAGHHRPYRVFHPCH